VAPSPEKRLRAACNSMAAQVLSGAVCRLGAPSSAASATQQATAGGLVSRLGAVPSGGVGSSASTSGPMSSQRTKRPLLKSSGGHLLLARALGARPKK
jgi:hypothetical protein